MKREHIGSRNPFTCPHATDKRVGEHILCDYGGKATWVNCQTAHFGEPAWCRMEEPDNSEEAMRARLEWLHGEVK